MEVQATWTGARAAGQLGVAGYWRAAGTWLGTGGLLARGTHRGMKGCATSMGMAHGLDHISSAIAAASCGGAQVMATLVAQDAAQELQRMRLGEGRWEKGWADIQAFSPPLPCTRQGPPPACIHRHAQPTTLARAAHRCVHSTGDASSFQGDQRAALEAQAMESARALAAAQVGWVVAWCEGSITQDSAMGGAPWCAVLSDERDL